MGGWGPWTILLKVQGSAPQGSVFSRYKGQGWWSSAIGPRQLEPKSTGDACSLWPSRRPRSDNVVGQLRCGPVWSAQLRFGSTGGGPRNSQQFPSGLQGGAEGTEITQAFSPKRYIHSLKTRWVQCTRQSSVPSIAHLSRPNLQSASRSCTSQSQLMDLAREGSRSPSHLRPLLMSDHLQSMARVQERTHTSMTKTERVFSARPGPPGSAWTSQGRNWDEHARTDLEAD